MASEEGTPPWSGDDSLYAGAARYYATGRVGYPTELADALAHVLGMDGTGRLLDIGCGPGSLTLLLAPYFAQAIGVDADADMLIEAARLASEAGIANVYWKHLRAEQLPADLPAVDVVTFAQSFHWMDRLRVAAAVREMLAPGGRLVHVGATTHEGVETSATLPYPQPPRQAINELVRSYLGPERRAGKTVLRGGTVSGEEAIYREAGFVGPQTLEIEGRVVTRTTDEVVGSVFSLSSSAPHLFGDRIAEFESELRQLLTATSPDGVFSQQMRAIVLDIWQ